MPARRASRPWLTWLPHPGGPLRPGAGAQRGRGGALCYAATCGCPLRESRAAGRRVRPAVRGPVAAARSRGRGRPGPSGQLAGFAYGHGWRWAEQADDWAAQLKDRLGDAADRLDGRFAVYLLAVHPWYRRAGLGRQLLQTLLSATKTGAWLITQDEPTPAMALYQREGWEPIGHGPGTPGAGPGLVLIHADPWRSRMSL